jgi:hypothetical protein
MYFDNDAGKSTQADSARHPLDRALAQSSNSIRLDRDVDRNH